MQVAITYDTPLARQDLIRDADKWVFNKGGGYKGTFACVVYYPLPPTQQGTGTNNIHSNKCELDWATQCMI